MSKSIKGLVTPSVLKWARDTAKMDLEEVSRRMKKTEEEILQWENGEEQPTFAQLKNIASIYRRPLAIFYLPEPPEEHVPLQDFRHLAAHEPAEWSSELAFWIRRMQMQQEWLREYLRLQEFLPLQFIGESNLNEAMLDIAKKIRSTLNIDTIEQISCKIPRVALNYWIAQAEQVGINVCQKGSIELDEARGFVLVDEYAPFIYINAKDSYAGRLFTLVHELAHIWLNLPGISNMNIPERSRRREEQIERFCNQVAGLALVPTKDLKPCWKPQSYSALLEHVDDIAKKFCVSGPVIARRLKDIGKIQIEEYQNLLRTYNIRYQNLPPRSAGGDGIRNILYQNGLLLVRTALDAISSGSVLASEVAGILNSKVNNFPKLRGILDSSY
ncbi:MAG: ImmA/IrrE family metallo-endopeptidase [Phycisphaerae bacterium]|nr:ImmA/IrrE family metallo-endopeptidase [Phycisphaerae bacterium]